VDFYNGVDKWTSTIADKTSLLRRGLGGVLTRTLRFNAQLTMRMDFTFYPGDKHALPIEVEIFSNPSNVVMFSESRVFLSEAASDLDMWSLTGVDWAVTEVIKPSTNLMYSRMTVHIEASRILTAYIFNLYGPMLLLQLISWGSIFIDPRAVPARTAVNIITVLSSYTFYQHVTQDLTKTGYVTIIDIVSVLTILQSALALAVFLRVHWLLRQKGKGPKEAGAPVVDWESRADNVDECAQKYFPAVIVFTQLIGMAPIVRSWIMTFDVGDIE
jgi:hypothetical protein